MGYYAKPEKQAQRVISWGLALGSGRRNDKSPALTFIPSARRTPTAALSPHSADGFRKSSSGISYRSMSKFAPLSLRNGRGRLARKPWTAIDRLFNTCWAEQPKWNIRLPRIKSTYSGGRHLAKQSRAYTRDQVEFICSKYVRTISTRDTYRLCYRFAGA